MDQADPAGALLAEEGPFGLVPWRLHGCVAPGLWVTRLSPSGDLGPAAWGHGHPGRHVFCAQVRGHWLALCEHVPADREVTISILS